MLRSINARIKCRVISELLKPWQRGGFFCVCVVVVKFWLVFFFGGGGDAVSDLS